MPFFDPIRIGASGAADDFTVDRSLRFNDDDSTYLTRTPSGDGNRRTFTISFWVKRANLTTGHMFQQRADSNDSRQFAVQFRSGDLLRVLAQDGGSTVLQLDTTQVFRDPSAWYHIVVAIDSTQSTQSDRQKLYVNGEQITDFDTSTQTSQDRQFSVNHASKRILLGNQRPNSSSTLSNYFDGYLAEYHLIDGLQLTPTSFGETNSTTGQWNPIDTSGLTFGTNGFRLQFADNSGTTATTLGKDTSGNGHNFTPNNFSVSAGAGNDSVTDTPTNNFCTYNPLDSHSNITLSNGNLTASISSGFKLQRSTFFLSSGKWYWEVTCDDVFPAGFLGITDSTDSTNSQGGASSSSCMIRTNNGDKRIGGSESSYGSGISDGDVMIFALDMDNGKFWAGKNGTFFNSGNPATGSNAATSNVTNPVTPSLGMYDNEDYTANFGQVKMDSTSYADANGHGAFKYSVPSGYLALCSANLPDPTILLPNKHFDTTLYTGNNSSQEISTLNFQPDWLWFKSRSSTSWHGLFDSVRGRALGLASNKTNSEYTSSASNDLVSFDDDGFTLGSNQNWGSVNGSGNSIVTWAWNGGDTDGKTYTVTVVSDSGNKYRFDGFGTSAVTLDLAEGGTYIFDQSDSSNSGHPLRFYTAADKTGGEYTTGVTTAGTPGSNGAYTQIVVAASAPTLFYQCSVHAGMGGQANTNSTLGSSNFDGTIQTTVKANTTAGFSIITYTGNGSSGATIGHGLGVTPNHVIWKERSGAENWINWQTQLADNALLLNLSNAQISASGNALFIYGDFNSTSLKLGNADQTNRNGDTYVTYCFSEVAGYSKFGSYTGNGSTDGTFVFTGFRPAFLIFKRSSSSGGSWRIFDNKRDTDNVLISRLLADSSGAEDTSRTVVDFLANGFKLRANNAGNNNNGDTYIYLAFAESPFKNARAR